MGVHHRRLEQLFEPVRIPPLCRLQERDLFGAALLHRSRIDQRIHFAVDTARRGVRDPRIAQPAFVGHFLIDRHLVLGVHQVEVAVGRDHTVREFARIVDPADTRTALFGRYDDHSGHGAGTVDRRGRSVFQNIETFDVFGIQTCDGRTDQGRGVSRGEILGRDVLNVFHDYSVHDPQRLRVSVNGGRTANADFRSRTERTRHVLYRNACRTAFEAAADIAHTGKFHVIGHQLIGRTGKEALVRFGHTCHHDCFHCLSVGFEAHADVGGDGCFLGFITYIGNLQLPPPLPGRDLKEEFALQVG